MPRMKSQARCRARPAPGRGRPARGSRTAGSGPRSSRSRSRVGADCGIADHHDLSDARHATPTARTASSGRPARRRRCAGPGAPASAPPSRCCSSEGTRCDSVSRLSTDTALGRRLGAVVVLLEPQQDGRIVSGGAEPAALRRVPEPLVLHAPAARWPTPATPDRHRPGTAPAARRSGRHSPPRRQRMPASPSR